MTKPGPRRPTHRLCAKPADGYSSVVGVAWHNANGSVSIRLSAGAVLRWDDGLMITAFPLDDKQPREAPSSARESEAREDSAQKNPTSPSPDGAFYDDDLPF